VRVAEYWLVNLLDHVVDVHRLTRAGGYEQRSVDAKGALIQLLVFPDVELAVDDFLR
jgi:Uma2 family endonuclease